jgi:hypothetical protein
MAATTLWFGPASYTTTLQGSSSPISVSTCKARCARVGLHAPRMTYLRKSASTFCFGVCFTSIVVSIPNPSSFSAAVVRSVAAS